MRDGKGREKRFRGNLILRLSMRDRCEICDIRRSSDTRRMLDTALLVDLRRSIDVRWILFGFSIDVRWMFDT